MRLLLAADLGLIEAGLKGSFLTDLQARVTEHAIREAMPLYGDNLAEHEAGQFLQAVQSQLSDFSLPAGNVTVDDVKSELCEQLGELLYKDIDVASASGSARHTFQVTLAKTYSDQAIDFALGLPDVADTDLRIPLGGHNAVEFTATWWYVFTFGVSESDGFFVDTSGADELLLDIDAKVGSFEGKGRMGLFTTLFTGSSGGFDGRYSMDVTGGGGGGLLQPLAAEKPGVSATVSGSGEFEAHADGQFVPDWLDISQAERDKVMNLAIDADVKVVYTSPAAAEVSYSGIELDTAEFLGGFFAPIIRALRPAFMHMQPVFENLYKPVPVISDLHEFVTGKPVSWLELSRTAILVGAAASKSKGLLALDRTIQSIALINTIVTGNVTSATGSESLGEYKVRYEKDTGKEVKESKPSREDKKKKLEKEGTLFAEVGPSMSFPVLEDSENIFKLMRGEVNDDVSLFSFGLDFGFGWEYELSYPTPIPFLSLKGTLETGLECKFDCGIDTLGIRRFADALDFSADEATLKQSAESNVGLLKKGFYFDDHFAEGNTQDGPGGGDAKELRFFSTLSAGPALGKDFGVAEIELSAMAYLTADIGLDLNDLPNVNASGFPIDSSGAPITNWDAGKYVYDGRVRTDEFDMARRSSPWAVMNCYGALSAGFKLGLEVTVGVDPFEVTLVDESWEPWDPITLLNYAIPRKVTDTQILKGQIVSTPVLGSLSGTTLTLYMGPDAGLRQGCIIGGVSRNTDTAEMFVVRSQGPTDANNPGAGETVEVEFDSLFVQKFERVEEIVADGRNDGDSIIVSGDTSIYVELSGGAGNDTLVYEGRGMADLDGGAGNDTLVGGDGKDDLNGGGGHDRLIGNAGDDDLTGLAGNDTLDGGAGDDKIYGGGDNDRLMGGAGDDKLHGQTGNDHYSWSVGGGNDIIIELDGEGNDSISFGGGMTLVGGGDDARNAAYNGADDRVTLQNNGGKLRVVTNVETITVDNIERVGVVLGDGADRITVNDLTGTDVTHIAVDLGESDTAANLDGNTVTLNGRSVRDTFVVEGWRNAVTGTDPIVKVTTSNADSSDEQVVLITSSDPASDELIVNGLGGDDCLSVAEDTVNGVRVRDLIGVTLHGGSGTNTFETTYSNVTVVGSDKDTLIVNGVATAGYNDFRPDARVYADRVQVDRGQGGPLEHEIIFSGIWHFTLNMNSPATGGGVVVKETPTGVVAPVTINGGAGGDFIAIEKIGVATNISAGTGNDTIRLGKPDQNGENGTLGFLTGEITISGGGGEEDRVVYNSSGLSDDLSVTVDGASTSHEVTGLLIPGRVRYDAAVEEVELLLGYGKDTVTVPDLKRRVYVSGGPGGDTVDATLQGKPTGGAGDPGIHTWNAELVELHNDSNSQATTWLLRDDTTAPQDTRAYNRLLSGEQVVVQTDLVGKTELYLGSGADTLTVRDVDRETHVYLRGGADTVSVGEFIPDVLWKTPIDVEAPLHLHGDVNDKLVLNDSANLTGAEATEPFAVTLGANVVSEYDDPARHTDAFDSIHFGGFGELTFTGSATARYAVSVEDTRGAESTAINFTGTANDTVTILGLTEALDIRDEEAGDTDTVIFDHAKAAAAVTGVELSDGGYTGFAGHLTYSGMEMLQVQLSPYNDELTVMGTPADVKTYIYGNGGEDHVTVKSVGGISSFDGGGDFDTLTLKVAGGGSVRGMDFEPGLELLVVDNAGGGSAEWVISLGTLYKGETKLLAITGAGETKIVADSADDTITITDESGNDVDAEIDGNKVTLISGEKVIQPEAFVNSGFEAPLEGLGLVGRGTDVAEWGDYVYVVSEDTTPDQGTQSSLSVFRRSGNNLRQIQIITEDVLPYDQRYILRGARRVLIEPDGSYVYVAASDYDAITVWRRDSASGMLKFSSVVRDGQDGVDGIAGVVDLEFCDRQSGNYLVAAGYEDDALAVFERSNGNLGFLQVVGDEALPGGARTLAGVRTLEYASVGYHISGELLFTGSANATVCAYSFDELGQLTREGLFDGTQTSYGWSVEGACDLHSFIVEGRTDRMLGVAVEDSGSLRVIEWSATQPTFAGEFDLGLGSLIQIETPPTNPGLLYAIGEKPYPYDGQIGGFRFTKGGTPGFAMETEWTFGNDELEDQLYWPAGMHVSTEHVYVAGIGRGRVVPTLITFSRMSDDQGGALDPDSWQLIGQDWEGAIPMPVDVNGLELVAASPDGPYVYAVDPERQFLARGFADHLETARGCGKLMGGEGMWRAVGVAVVKAGLQDHVHVTAARADGSTGYWQGAFEVVNHRLELVSGSVHNHEEYVPLAIAGSPDGTCAYSLYCLDRISGGRIYFITAYKYNEEGSSADRGRRLAYGSPSLNAAFLAASHSYLCVLTTDERAVLYEQSDVFPPAGTAYDPNDPPDPTHEVIGLPGACAAAFAPDETRLYVVSESQSSLYVVNPVTGAKLQTLTDGVAGVYGLAGANAVGVSPDGTYVYVTGGAGNTLAVFKRDDETGELRLVQVLRNGNSATLGLRGPTSLVVDKEGKVIVGSSGGSLTSGGVATFRIDTTAPDPSRYAVSFERPGGIAGLTVETGGGDDTIRQVNPAAVTTTTIRTGDGDDRVELANAAGTTVVQTEAGADQVGLRSSTGSTAISTGSDGDGVDILDAGVSTTVRTGDGEDVLELRPVDGSGSVDVDAGDDADEIYIRRMGSGLTGPADGNRPYVKGGAGNDTIWAWGADLASSVKLNGLGGSDTLWFYATGTLELTDTLHGAVKDEDPAKFLDWVSIETRHFDAQPLAEANGPYTINEGEGLTLRSADSNLFGREGTFQWDLNADGVFGDVTGPGPVLSWSFLRSMGLNDDGTHTIGLRVENDRGQTGDDLATVQIRNVSAAVALSGAGSVVAGQAFGLTATVSDPGDDHVTRWRIDWRDGNVLEYDRPGGEADQQFVHVYDQPGRYTISARAWDEDNAGDATGYTATRGVTVTAPTPIAGGPYTVIEGGSVTLTGQAGSGTPNAWAWDLDGDGFDDGSAQSVGFDWEQLEAAEINDDGAYTIRLRVTYPSGHTAVADATLTVVNAPPTATFGHVAGDFEEGDTVPVSFTGPSDPSSSDVTLGFTYSYDLDGDGAFEIGPSTATEQEVTIGQAGSYVVLGRVYDKDGGYTEYATSIVAAEVEPTLEGLPDETVPLSEGQELALTLRAIDPGNDVVSQWIVDWGDGTAATVVEDAEPDVTHVFADDSGEGTFPVEVTAVDNDGVYGETFEVAVSNVAPELCVAALPRLNEGDRLRLLLDWRDPGNDRLNYWTIDWGDDSQPETVAGSVRMVTHAYADDSAGGTFPIVVTAVDEDTTPDAPYPVTHVVELDRPVFTFAGSGRQGHYYLPTSVALSRVDAAAEAAGLNGQLVTVNGPDEQGLLDAYFLAGREQGLWIGLTRVPGTAAPRQVAAEGVLAAWDAAAPGDEPGTVWQAGVGGEVWAFAGAVALDGGVASNRALAKAYGFNGDGPATADLGGLAGFGTGGATWELWLAPDELASNGQMILHAGDETASTSLRLEGGLLVCRVAEGGLALEAAAELTADDLADLMQVMVTIEAGEGTRGRVSLFVNGQLRGTDVASGDERLTTWAGSGEALLAGPLAGLTDPALEGCQGFAGRIASVRLYGRALSAEEAIDNFLAVAAAGSDWQWDGGEPVEYVNFAGDEPSSAGNAVLLTERDGAGRWISADASGSHYGIVEVGSLFALGGVAEDTFHVTVDNVAPFAELRGPASVQEGSPFMLTIGSPFDPGDDRVAHYVISWGDGVEETLDVPTDEDAEPLVAPTSGGKSSVRSLEASHQYADGPATPEITIRLVDEDGEYANEEGDVQDVTLALTVEVDDVEPTVVLSGPTAVDEGDPYTLRIGPAMDPGADVVSSYTVDWGDGETSIVPAVPGQDTVEAGHVYLGAGDRTISVDVQDEDGTYAKAATKNVTVLDVPPVVDVSGPVAVNEMSTFTLSLDAVRDPGAASGVEWNHLIVRWGDGDEDTHDTLGDKTHVYRDGDFAYTILVDVVTEDDTTFYSAGRHDVFVENVPPTATDDAYAIDEDGTLVIDAYATGVLDNDTDPPDELTATLVTDVAHGELTLHDDGTFTYAPDENWHGTDSFTYRAVDDDNDESNEATATLTVHPVNDQPLTFGQSVKVLSSRDVIELVAADVETDPLEMVYTIVQPPAHGTLEQIGVNGFHYEPGPGFDGQDSFQFTATDNGDPAGSHANAGDLISEPATVTVSSAGQRKPGRNGKVVFQDATGTWVTLSLRGPGEMTLYFADAACTQLSWLVLHGTTVRSSLTVATKGRGSTTAIGDVTVRGSLAQITAKTTTLLGDMTVSDRLKKLQLDDVDAWHAIDIGANVDPADVGPRDAISLTFDHVIDTRLNTNALPIRSLTATEWLDLDGQSDAIRSPWIGKIVTSGGRTPNKLVSFYAGHQLVWVSVPVPGLAPVQGVPGDSGDFQADLYLSGAGLAPGKPVLGSASIAGQLACNWDIDGPIGTIKADSTAGTWSLVADGKVHAVRTTGPLAGDLSALYFGTLSTRGDFTAAVTASGFDARRLTSVGSLIAGSVRDVSMNLAGGLGSASAVDWIDTDGAADTIQAGWLGKVTTKGLKANPAKGIVGSDGDFDVRLDLTNTNVPARRPVLGSARIKGGVADASWDLHGGDAGAVRIAGAVDGWAVENGGACRGLTLGNVENANVTFADALGAVRAQRWAAGKLEADSVRSLTITGYRGSARLGLPAVDGDFGADVTVAGKQVAPGRLAMGAARIGHDLTGSAWDVAGHVGKLTVTHCVVNSTVASGGRMDGLVLGACEGSDFHAGVDAGTTRRPDEASDFGNPDARIRSIAIKGWRVAKGQQPPRFLADSNFCAASIGSVSLLNAQAGDTYGLFVLADADGDEQVKSVNYRDTVSGEKWTWKPGQPWLVVGSLTVESFA